MAELEALREIATALRFGGVMVSILLALLVAVVIFKEF